MWPNHSIPGYTPKRTENRDYLRVHSGTTHKESGATTCTERRRWSRLSSAAEPGLSAQVGRRAPRGHFPRRTRGAAPLGGVGDGNAHRPSRRGWTVAHKKGPCPTWGPTAPPLGTSALGKLKTPWQDGATGCERQGPARWPARWPAGPARAQPRARPRPLRGQGCS